MSEFLKRPNVNYEMLKELDQDSAKIPFDVAEQVEILTKYERKGKNYE